MSSTSGAVLYRQLVTKQVAGESSLFALYEATRSLQEQMGASILVGEFRADVLDRGEWFEVVFSRPIADSDPK